MAAAPFVSLVVVPWAFSRRPKATARKAETDEEALGLARGGRFAVAVLCIMIAEQTLLNGGVLAADINATDAAVAGYVFNALLIARAPLQLFQAVQGSLLPHLAGLEATEGRARVQQGDPDHDPRHRGLRRRRGARPADPRPVRDETCSSTTTRPSGASGWRRSRSGWAPTSPRARSTRPRSPATTPAAAAAAWLVSAAVFVAWMLLDVVDDALTRAEVGYLGAASLLCVLLAVVLPPAERVTRDGHLE